MSELDALNANLDWLRKSMEKNDKTLEEIFERLRAIETDLSAMKANQRQPISGWSIFGIIATVAVAALVILDRIYVNQ
jgi:hypothetical protein